jgi:tripartite-type tricarboxylate transporter receptor subunit TctC
MGSATWARVASSVVGLFLSVWGAATGATEGPSLAGKTVVLLVGSAPGGGFDRLARVLAKHLPKHLPGRPVVVVQNMPGAGGIVAANHLYHAVRPDGLTIALLSSDLLTAQLTGAEGVRFDMLRFQWIGSPVVEAGVLAIRADLPVRDWRDLRRPGQSVVVGLTGPGSFAYNWTLLLKAFLGLNLRPVVGYPSAAEIILAMERKEVDAYGFYWSSAQPYLQRGFVRPVIRTVSDIPEMREIPADADLVPEGITRRVLLVRSTVERIGRPLLAPPDTPGAMISLHREALRRLSEDSDFVVEVRRAGFVPGLKLGEEALRMAREFLRAEASVVRILREIYR